MTTAAHPADEELLHRFVAGGSAADQAFDRLVDRHARRVYAVCLRYFCDPVDAEDAAQETFVLLLRHASTYRGGAAFSTWLHRVTMNACHDLARRRRRGRGGLSRSPDLPTLDDSDSVGSVHEDHHERALSPALAAALAGLDPDTRDAVVLHDVAGLPYAEVAARMAMPVGTVKSRIHRAHARLAADLAAAAPREVRS